MNRLAPLRRLISLRKTHWTSTRTESSFSHSSDFAVAGVVPIRYPLSVRSMRPSLHHPIAPGKEVAAFVCLLAVLLLWAPAWAAALQSNQLDCCADGLCPAHGLHHKSSEPASHPAQAPMDCDQQHSSPTQSGFASCSLSCCQDSDRPTTTAVIFVLPSPAQLAEPALTLSAPPRIALTSVAHVSDPRTPPPRALVSSL
jgi:hypothetical protein